MLPIALIHGVPDASAGAWAWTLVASVCSLTGLGLMFTALQHGRVGLVAATISVQGAFASVYAAIGGEALHPLSVVAIAVSAAGTFVLMGVDGGLRRRRASGSGSCSRWPPPASPSGTVRGLARWLGHPRRLGRGLRGGMASVAMVLVPLAVTRRLKSPSGCGPFRCSSRAWAEVAAFGAYIAATDRIGVAVPAVIASQFALIAAAVGWFVLGERLGLAAAGRARGRFSPA